MPTQSLSFLKDDETFQNISDNDGYIDDLLSSTLYQPEEVSEDVIPTIEQTSQDILELTRTDAYEEYLEGYHQLLRVYVDSAIKGDRDVDNKYGFTHDIDSEKWKIWNKNVDF